LRARDHGALTWAAYNLSVVSKQIGLAVVVALGIGACSSAPEIAPRGDAEQTRIAAGLRIIATAAPLPTQAAEPSATPPAYPTAVPLVTATDVAVITATPETAVASSTTASGSQHVVAPGDTLSVIANRYSTSIAALQIENDLSDQNVRAGATLKLPAQKLADDENVFWFIHVVKAGETLLEIAQRFGVAPADVLRVNKLSDASRLRVGQRLIIPVKQPIRSSDATLAQPELSNAPLPAPTVTPIPFVQAAPAITPIPVAQDLILLDTTPEVLRPAVAPQPEIHSPPAQVAQPAGMVAELLALYNEQRSAQGLAPLAYSALLQSSAQAHADECAARNACGHVGLDGSSARDRIRRVGYAGRWTGENWAWGRSAAGAFDLWFHQETPDGPHRKNIMSPNYREVGFGVAQMNGGFVFIANLGG
jgi:uncharacterized protein YkwD